MARMPNPFGPAQPFPMEYESRGDAVSVARFFNAVYAWMAAGLAVTALVAWYVSSRPEDFMWALVGPMRWVLLIAQIAMVVVISAAVNRLSAAAATALFLLYAAVNGLTLSVLFLVYAQSTLAGAFVVTAGTFGAMSLYGMFTKRDLTALGSFLFMALIGLVLASVVSIFWHNTILQVAINYVGVLIFIGLTAYDTQRLKAVARATAHDAAMAARYSVNGALTLYLDFINMFLFILRAMGDRR